jgi:hypothetical protein
MNLYKKIANRKFEPVASMTTRSASRHGLGRGLAKEKRYRNRQAKREEARIDFASQLE